MSYFSGHSAKAELRPFEPREASASQWQALHAFRRLRSQEDFPGEPVMSDADFESELRVIRPLVETRRVLAVHDDAIAGIMVLNYRRAGSPGSEDHAGYVDVAGGVAQALRRRGVGRALLAGLVDFMEVHGKHTATAKAHLPDSHVWMAGIGAICKLRMFENRSPFDRLDWEMLTRWARPAGLAAAGLHWEVHGGRVPMQTLAPLMDPFTELINDQPLGRLDIPRIRYEMKDYESWYADLDRRGGDHFLVLLRDGEQRVAAMCDATWDARFPDRLYQQLTAVARPWRGHGLAKAVKARMLELVRASDPGVRTVLTHNAVVNAAMLSINNRLGFAVHKEDVTYQIDLATLRAHLARRLA
ncbi:GNAT family N-acetyltransferase [Variovorax sp. dw_308]|uniref:GNAT family N-acetyltransferase n=1 Tax=Variovorax sp. dw_308 TaxID=2721546 RepID=UPI001C438465|nr:GNAT family N-acetyltransferase [Variovorax sp. dw_308]